MKYKIPAVSQEVGALLQRGGRVRDSFLLQIADAWPARIKFSQKYHAKLQLIDVNTETRRREPLYVFEKLGGFNYKGLRNSL